MPNFQQIILRHTNKRENMVHSKEQNKLRESILEEAQALDILNKVFNVNCLKYAQRDEGNHGQRAK